MNKSYLLDSPYFIFKKKHYCLSCNQLLNLKKTSKVINSKSPEAKDFDFSCGDSYLSGDVEFFYNMFYCEKCNIFYSLNEIKDIEKQKNNFESKNKRNISKKEIFIVYTVIFILMILFFIIKKYI